MPGGSRLIVLALTEQQYPFTFAATPGQQKRQPNAKPKKRPTLHKDAEPPRKSDEHR
jgi:hypothetical protein